MTLKHVFFFFLFRRTLKHVENIFFKVIIVSTRKIRKINDYEINVTLKYVENTFFTMIIIPTQKSLLINKVIFSKSYFNGRHMPQIYAYIPL